MIQLKKELKKMFGPLNQRGGGAGFFLVFIVFFVTMAIYFAFSAVIKSQYNVAASHKFTTRSLQMADAALDQALSKIRNHEITLPLDYVSPPTITPTVQGGIPMTLTIPVGTGSSATTAYARIDFYRGATPLPGTNTPTPGVIRDIENNIKYVVEAVVEDKQAVGSRSKTNVKRGITGIFVIVNLGRYALFSDSSDVKTTTVFDGNFHTNGNLTMNSNCDWNDKNLTITGSGAVNDFYSASYTTVAAGTVIDQSGTWVSQANVTLNGSGGTFTTAPNVAGTPTFFDGANGGFAVALPAVPSNQFNTQAHLLLDTNILNNTSPAEYQTQNGVNVTGNVGGAVTVAGGGNQLMDVGVTVISPLPVRINLNALNKGATTSGSTGVFGEWKVGDGYLGATTTEADTNYATALISTYGLVIYVKGDCVVWGQIPNPSSAAATHNKKITIAATGNIHIIGDILVSQSPYTSGTKPANDLDPSPLIDNPNDDAIALLSSTGNIYQNAWFCMPSRSASKYFIKPATTSVTTTDTMQGTPTTDDWRIDAFLYCPNGYTGGRLSQAAGSSAVGSGLARLNHSGIAQRPNNITFHGCLIVKQSGDNAPNKTNRLFDPKMRYNLSSIIPSATALSSWQEEVSPRQMP